MKCAAGFVMFHGSYDSLQYCKNPEKVTEPLRKVPPWNKERGTMKVNKKNAKIVHCKPTCPPVIGRKLTTIEWLSPKKPLEKTDISKVAIGEIFCWLWYWDYRGGPVDQWPATSTSTGPPELSSCCHRASRAMPLPTSSTAPQHCVCSDTTLAHRGRWLLPHLTNLSTVLHLLILLTRMMAEMNILVLHFPRGKLKSIRNTELLTVLKPLADQSCSGICCGMHTQCNQDSGKHKQGRKGIEII